MNIIKKYTGRSLWLAGLMMTALMAGCLDSGSSNNNDDDVNAVPTVLETVPADSATGVSLNSTTVIASFSEAMDATTITDASFTLSQNGTEVNGTVEYSTESKTASFDAGSVDFIAETVYTARITTTVEDSTGLPLAADYVWTFTTGSAAETDLTAPTVMSTNPADAEVDFPLNRNVSANFSEALDPTTVNSSNFTVKQGTTSVSGEVTYSNKVATFNPASDLLASTVYTATLNGSITDLAGNALASETWTFTTGDNATVAAGPAPINLRTAADFAILTGAGITSADGSAAVTGNIGTSGITGASITLACSELDGFEIFTDDASPISSCTSADKTAASIALGDVLTAYTQASDPATPAGVGEFLNLGAGTLTAQTLEPGVYTWGSNVSITGEITLDGGPNDVWVFQIDGKLNTTQAMTLTGGALAKNVFWRVSDVVTLGTGTQFKGVVLAKTRVDLITSAAIQGRLLAQTAVALGSTTVVTQPAE